MINAQLSVYDHFSRVASSYNEIRTTDLEPILFIKDRLDGYNWIEAADIGCGAGRYCLTLFHYVPNLHLTCVDFNDSMLEETSVRLREAWITNFKTIQSHAEDVPLRDNSMDCIFTFNAIHHLDCTRFIEKMAKVVKDGGIIFIYTRLRSQNAKNIWGSHFPLFLEKENRLYELDELEEMVKAIESLTIESIRTFRYRRSASLNQLVTLARNNHYSTFSLYRQHEFEASLKRFQKNIIKRFSLRPAPPEQLPFFCLQEVTARNICVPEEIEWFDENILLVIRKGLA